MLTQLKSLVCSVVRVVESVNLWCIFVLHYFGSTSIANLNCIFHNNMYDSYMRACNIFSSQSKLVSKLTFSNLQLVWYDILHSFLNWFWQLHIWDLSGKTTKLVMNQGLSFPEDTPVPPSREVSSFRPGFCKYFELWYCWIQ